MKRSILWLSIAVLAVACGQKQEELKPQEKELTAAVYASGTLVPEQEYKVMPTVDGYITEAYVKEGDTVSDGQLLFKIGNRVRTAQEEAARRALQSTLPATGTNAPVFRELESRIELARIKMQQDSLQYARYKRLYEENAISQSAYEKYYLQYQSSLKELQNLQKQLQQQRLSANLQEQQAQNQLMVSSAQVDVGNLRSHINGVVYEIYKETGDLVVPNQPVALIGSDNMIARLLVDEDDLEKVYAGQKVLITMDAYPDKVFKAHIEKVYPLLNKVEQSFRVDALLDEPLPTAMYGLNLEANIVTQENKKVLAIPRRALLKGDSVLIERNGEQVKVKIEKGIEDDSWVEVKSGLDKNATIIVEP